MSSPSRQPDSATTSSVCSASSAWLTRGTALVPARLARDSRRLRLRQPAGFRASRTRCGPRDRSPMPRKSSLTGSRWPGSRARSGRGRVGRPSWTSGRSRVAPPGAGRRGRAGDGDARPRRPRRDPAPAASHSSTSTPTTGWSPASSAAPDEADRAVQAVVVRGGQPGQPQLHGPGDQLVRRRGPVEEREVRVGVELGVGDRGRVRHGCSGRRQGVEGAGHRRTDVLSCHHETPEAHRASVGHAIPAPAASPAPTGRSDRAPDGLHAGAGLAPDLRRPAGGHRGPGGDDLAPHTVSAPGGSGRAATFGRDDRPSTTPERW